MGIQGLTTYLKQNKRSLSQTIELHPGEPTSRATVVDGWSFIYTLWQNSGLPWVYGGEYAQFSALVIKVVEAWLRVGLKPVFVFDGPSPAPKLTTNISRTNQSFIQPSILFFRTSETARATPRFLAESRIRPPLVYFACISALMSLAPRVECQFADEEGDPYAVELAGRIRGCVAGSDSDFAVLTKEGYRGYIPLDEMIWLEEPTATIEDQDPEFQRVKKGKNKPITTRRGLVPPSADTSLSVSIYHPDRLATALGLPVTLLPLLGALVGNDFSSFPRLFFEKKLGATQRIITVANLLSGIFNPRAQKARQQPLTVLEIIDEMVTKLLLKPIQVDEQNKIVDTIANSTLQYSIPKSSGPLWPSPECALHQPQSCVLPALLSSCSTGNVEQDQVRSLYLEAYRSGCLAPEIMDVLSTGTMWPTLFLEDPDIPSPTRVIGRKIRLWMYAILDGGVGLPVTEAAIAEPEVENGDVGDDDDELISVIEEHSDEESTDPLVALQDALRRLELSNDGLESERQSVQRLPKAVIEYVRRGTRVVAETLRVPILSEMLTSINHAKAPLIQLQPIQKRLDVFLSILEADHPIIRELAPAHMMLVVSLRYILQATNQLQDTTSKWTRDEVAAFLASCLCPDKMLTEEFPPILSRSIRLTSHVCSAFEAIEHLSMAMLLSTIISGAAQLFSGRRFHAYLASGTFNPPNVELWKRCWEAVSDLEDMFGVHPRRVKKEKSARVKPVKGRDSIYLYLAESS